MATRNRLVFTPALDLFVQLITRREIRRDRVFKVTEVHLLRDSSAANLSNTMAVWQYRRKTLTCYLRSVVTHSKLVDAVTTYVTQSHLNHVPLDILSCCAIY